MERSRTPFVFLCDVFMPGNVIMRAMFGKSKSMNLKVRARSVGVIFLLGLLVLPNGYAADERDPFERANRAVLKFNLKVDRYALKPVAKTFAKLPSPVRNGVGNFFSNLWQPNTILNDLLQGKWAHAGRDTGRFVINTTLGLFGLMDVATALDLPKRKEDLGQTLAVWGVPEGPYLMLPLLGPRNLRDAVGTVPKYGAIDPVTALDSPQREYASGLRVVDGRARLLNTDDVLERQPDQYLFLREVYRQQRTQLIYDGAPPTVLEDDLLDELLEEEDEN